MNRTLSAIIVVLAMLISPPVPAAEAGAGPSVSTIAAKMGAGAIGEEDILNEREIPRFEAGTIEAFLVEKLSTIKNDNLGFHAADMKGPGVMISGLSREVFDALYTIMNKNVRSPDKECVVQRLCVVAIAVNELGLRDPYAVMAALVCDTFSSDVGVQVSKDMVRVGLKPDTVHAVNAFIRAMNEPSRDALSAAYLSRIVEAGMPATLMILAEQIYRMRNLKYRTDPGAVESYLLGDIGVIEHFFTLPLARNKGSFVDSILARYPKLKTYFRREVMKALQENYTRMPQVSSVAEARGLVMRVAGLPSFPRTETFATIDGVFAAAIEMCDPALPEVMPFLEKSRRPEISVALYTDLSAEQRQAVRLLMAQETTQFDEFYVSRNNALIRPVQSVMPARTAFTEGEMDSFLLTSMGNILVALRGQTVVGLKKFMYTKLGRISDGSIYVADAERGRGCGYLLRKTLFFWLYDQGYRTLVIKGVRSTEEAKAFHRRLVVTGAVTTNAEGGIEVNLQRYVNRMNDTGKWYTRLFKREAKNLGMSSGRDEVDRPIFLSAA